MNRDFTQGSLASIKTLGIPVLFSLVSIYEYWGPSIYLASCFYLHAMQMKQDEINDLVKFINDHPTEFRKEIVESKEFQDGFILILENYLKERNKEKRKLIEKILLGFAISEDKEHFHLEKLNEVISKISLDALEYLVYLKKERYPLLQEGAKLQAKHHLSTTSLRKGRDFEYWYKHYLEHLNIFDIPLIKNGRNKNKYFSNHEENVAWTKQRAILWEFASLNLMVEMNINNHFSFTQLGIEFLDTVLVLEK